MILVEGLQVVVFVVVVDCVALLVGAGGRGSGYRVMRRGEQYTEVLFNFVQVDDIDHEKVKEEEYDDDTRIKQKDELDGGDKVGEGQEDYGSQC